MDDILELNVGGRVFVTTRGTLCAEAGSMLSSKFDPESSFAPPKAFRGATFIDRNPQTFEIVLDYLRNGCTLVSDIVPDDLVKYVKADADYFGLGGLKRACDSQQLQKLPNTKPLNHEVCGNVPNKMYRAISPRGLGELLLQGYQIEREFPDLIVNGKVIRECQFLLSKNK